MDQISKQFVELDIRAEAVIHIGTAGSESLADVLSDALDDDLDEIAGVMGIDPDDLDDSASECFYDQGKTGWLVKFGTPVPEYAKLDGAALTWSYSRSWGYYSLVLR